MDYINVTKFVKMKRGYNVKARRNKMDAKHLMNTAIGFTAENLMK